MGDRTGQTLLIHKDDLDRAVPLLSVAGYWNPEAQNEDGSFFQSDMKGVGNTTVESLKAAGIRYVGFHGGTYYYGPGRFLFDGEETLEWETGHEEGYVFVPVLESDATDDSTAAVESLSRLSMLLNFDSRYNQLWNELSASWKTDG